MAILQRDVFRQFWIIKNNQRSSKFLLKLDFTLKTYNKLIKSLINQGFLFQTLSDSLTQRGGKTIILRHDVDSLPANSLKFARIQSEIGIKGTYYFRIVPESFDEKIILEIYKLGHEVGYHYEDLSFAQAKLKAQGTAYAKASADKAGHRAQGEEMEKLLVEIGIESFGKNLEKLRKIVPVKIICMHGSPMSKWDSRLLWKYYDYHDFGIIGEPYFDVDFNEVLYLTDTGRRWDGDSVNIRDKSFNRKERKTVAKDAKSLSPLVIPEPSHRLTIAPSHHFHSTLEIIRAAEKGQLPEKIMMTFHPQRWTDKPLPWVKELVWQNVKNVGKYFIIRLRAVGSRLQVFSSLPPTAC